MPRNRFRHLVRRVLETAYVTPGDDHQRVAHFDREALRALTREVTSSQLASQARWMVADEHRRARSQLQAAAASPTPSSDPDDLLLVARTLTSMLWRQPEARVYLEGADGVLRRHHSTAS